MNEIAAHKMCFVSYCDGANKSVGEVIAFSIAPIPNDMKTKFATFRLVEWKNIQSSLWQNFYRFSILFCFIFYESEKT